MTPKHADSVICPKCGYDQSGHVDTWTDRCPLQGVCTECGLEFDWVDVMDAKRVRLHWYSEHASGFKQMLARTPSTILRLLFPPVFWSRVTVMMEVRLRSLLLWVLTLAIGMHLLASIFVGLGVWTEYGVWRYGSFSQYISSFGILGVARLIFNAIFAGVAYMEFDPSGDLFFGFSLGSYSPMSDNWFVLLPFSGIAGLWLIVLLVIPTTRKLAKLRGVHIARAAIISALVILMIFQCARAMSGIQMWVGIPNWIGILVGWIFIAIAVWFLVFWASAVRTGWKIRPSWLLILLGTIASILGGIVAIALPTLLS
jgi:hypothetical protein